MKVVFNNKFILNRYKLLQNCLEIKLNFLSKVIIYKFININIHLLIYIKIYGILINIQIGIKEIVYHIFKGIVLKINHKNINLDLLKYYTILFAIKHLTDGSIDSRFIRPYTGFINMISNFNQLFLN